MELRPLDTVRFSLADIRSRIRKAVRFGLIFGLIFGLSAGLGYGLISGLDEWLIVGLSVGLGYGLPAGLIKLLCAEAVEIRTRSNQGTRRSVVMALSVMLSAGLIFGLSAGLILGLDEGLIAGLIAGLSVGLSAGPIAGLIAGGAFFLRHFVIRLALWISRSAPLNYVRFLDYAAERLFLYKVGGGYIFVHRFLRDYFASLADSGQR